METGKSEIEPISRASLSRAEKREARTPRAKNPKEARAPKEPRATKAKPPKEQRTPKTKAPKEPRTPKVKTPKIPRAPKEPRTTKVKTPKAPRPLKEPRVSKVFKFKKQAKPLEPKIATTSVAEAVDADPALKPKLKKVFHIGKLSGQRLVAVAFILVGVLAFAGAIVGSTINTAQTAHHVTAPAKTPTPKKTKTPSTPKPTITPVPVPTPTATAVPLTSVNLGSITLQVPANWTSTPAAGSQLAFEIPDSSGSAQPPVVTFDDLGAMSSVSLPVLSTAAQTISQTGATVGVPTISKNGVGSFSAIEGADNIEVRVVIVGGHAVLVTLTLTQLDPAASTAVSNLVNTLGAD